MTQNAKCFQNLDTRYRKSICNWSIYADLNVIIPHQFCKYLPDSSYLLGLSKLDLESQ